MREIYKQGKVLTSSHATAAKRITQLPPKAAKSAPSSQRAQKLHNHYAHQVPRHPTPSRTAQLQSRLTARLQYPVQGVSDQVTNTFARLEDDAIKNLNSCSTGPYPDIDEYCMIGQMKDNYCASSNFMLGVYPPVSDNKEKDTQVIPAAVVPDEMTPSEMYSATVDTLAKRLLTDLSTSTMLMMVTMLTNGPGVGVLAGNESPVNSTKVAVVPEYDESCLVEEDLHEQPHNDMVEVPIVTAEDAESVDDDGDFEVIHNYGFEIDEDDWEQV